MTCSTWDYTLRTVEMRLQAVGDQAWLMYGKMTVHWPAGSRCHPKQNVSGDIAHSKCMMVPIQADGARGTFPNRRRRAVGHALEQGMSERRACRMVNQPRGPRHYQPTQREDEDRLTQVIIELASQYGATVAGASRHCCSERTGELARIGSSESDVAKG
jgi:hypothetical protein